MIPKIIHYCWFGGNEFSEKEIKCIDSWKKYCPNYKIKRWDESNFNIHINKYVEQAYSCKKWAFVSDYARFWILYQYGGLYFDNDVELIKPIDDIVAKGPFFGLEKTEFSYAPIALAPGLGIGAEKGNTLIQEILETYDKKAFIKQDGNYDDTTVVTTVTNIFKKYGLKQSNTIQVIKDFYVYPDDYFSPMNYKTGEIKITSNTRSIHHYAGSWFSESEKKIRDNQYKLVKKFGKEIGMRLGKIYGSHARFFERLKSMGLINCTRYYLRLLKK